MVARLLSISRVNYDVLDVALLLVLPLVEEPVTTFAASDGDENLKSIEKGVAAFSLCKGLVHNKLIAEFLLPVGRLLFKFYRTEEPEKPALTIKSPDL
jgi:hypothetical protein